MKYFGNFPTTLYTFDGMNGATIQNFMARVTLSSDLLNNPLLFTPYSIQDGEKPEHVAAKVYGDATLHWIILICNNIVDPRFDWCLSSNEFESYMESKYGTDEEIYATHHYVDPTQAYIVDSDYTGAIAISNYQFESDLNESKRIIQIMQSSLVAQFITEFQTDMSV